MEFDSKKYWQMEDGLGYQFTAWSDGDPLVIRLSSIETISREGDGPSYGVLLGVNGNAYSIKVKEDFDTVRTILDCGRVILKRK